jgi:hypothetical protein
MFANVGGYNLSQRLSLGDVFPMTRALASNADFNSAASEAWADLGGPSISLATNIMKAASDRNPNGWKRAEAIMPTAMKNLSRAVRGGADGTVKDNNGAVIFEPSEFQMLGYATGFQPAGLSKAYESRNVAQEAYMFWDAKRDAIMRNAFYVFVEHRGDREGAADWRKSVAEYNKNVPDKSMVISAESISKSIANKAKGNKLVEFGLARNKAMMILAKDTRENLGVDSVAELRRQRLEKLRAIDEEMANMEI